MISGIPRAFRHWGGGGVFVPKFTDETQSKITQKITYFRVWKCGKTWRFKEITIGVFTINTGVASRFTTRGETRICRPQAGYTYYTSGGISASEMAFPAF